MSFTATLYNCSDDPRKLNKTLPTQSKIEVSSITPTASCDILNPTFILDYNSAYTTKNYIVVDSPFNRSYFITDMKIDIGKKIVISCGVDVLQTYKDNIKKIKTTIVRNEKPSDKMEAPYLPDPLFNIEAGFNYDYKQFEKNWFVPSNGTYVLSWVGDEYDVHYIQISVQPADWTTAWGKYYYLLDGEFVSCLVNYPYNPPDFNVLSNSFGVYERITA